MMEFGGADLPQSTAIDEHELVSRCLAGDRASREKLVDHFLREVFTLCLGLLGHLQDAEDAAQETFVRVLRFLDRWDGRPLRPWIFTIATNCCRNQRRGKKMLVEMPEGSLAFEHPSLAESLDEQTPVLEAAIMEGLSQLRFEYRMAIVLHHHLHQPIDRVGEILNSPSGTVKTWLSRGRNALWEWLESNGYVNRLSRGKKTEG